MLRNATPDLACPAVLLAFVPSAIGASEREDGLRDFVLADPASRNKLISGLSTVRITQSKATRPEPSVTAIPLDVRLLGSAGLGERSRSGPFAERNDAVVFSGRPALIVG